MKIKGQIRLENLIKSEIDEYKKNCNFSEVGSVPEVFAFDMRCKGYSPQYIATTCNCSVETVYSVLRKILNKLKTHIAEEKGDAQAYYEMAKAAKEAGETKLAFTLSGICQDEIRHGEKITQCIMNAGMANPLTDKDKEETEILKWKLSRM